jgi:pyruvate,orthophosphate dikinase
LVDPGLRSLVGDFKFSAAGEDLVAGLTKFASFRPIEELESLTPMLARRLRHIAAKLRRFMGTDQEIEFTVERGVLSVLQSRAAEVGKNRREAAFKDPGEEAARGIGVRGGAFRGIVAFDKEDIEDLARSDFSKRDDADGVILVLESPAPEHIHLILAADALLAAKGGSSSHAAITVNGIENRDYYAVMSAAGLTVDAHRKEATILARDGTARHTIHKGDLLSIHGTTGSVYMGTHPIS